MDFFHRMFGNSWNSYFQNSSGGSPWIKDYKIFVCRGQCCNTFLTGYILAFLCFLRKLWVCENIYLKFVKPWEMKSLPLDREKGSKTVWHTVKPWKLRGLPWEVYIVNIIVRRLTFFHFNVFLKKVWYAYPGLRTVYKQEYHNH